MKDEKGSTTIQSLLFIAIFVLILSMAFELWKVVAVKQSVQAATYQAAKYIALNGLNWGLSEKEWEIQVWPFIVTELRNNPFIPVDSFRAGGLKPNPDIRIILNPQCNRQNYCDRGQFSIQVGLEYIVFIPPRFGEPNAKPMQLKFTRSVQSQLECYP